VFDITGVAGPRVSCFVRPGSPSGHHQEADVEPEQQERFKQAVERKARESEAASRAPQHDGPGGGGVVAEDQESLRSASQPQDTFSPREKNTRSKKVTADKWNQ
jgi:hypothetical protein